MPLYDYTCLDCHQRFDVFMTFSEYGTRPVACPHCKSSEFTKETNILDVFEKMVNKNVGEEDTPV